MRLVSLIEGAKKVVEVSAAVKSGEKLLIVTDTGRPFSIMEALAIAGENVGAVVCTIIMKPILSGQEPPDPIKGAMLGSDVILAPTSGSLAHTSAVIEAVGAGGRFISMTEMSEELLTSGAILADFEGQGPRIENVRSLLSDANEANITSPGGTELSLSIKDRVGMKVTSLARDPGSKTAVPDLEAFIAPVEGTAKGVLVVDASASIVGLIRTPVRMEIEEGRVTHIQGDAQAREISRILASTNDDRSYVVAELGIGLNPAGLIRGHIIEDEGVYGTAHIGLGRNTTFLGGKNNAPVHFDYVFWDPNIELDGELIMEKGNLVDTD